ncbi:hypothetical protein ABVT39_006701 [Epinephelus coioides]
MKEVLNMDELYNESCVLKEVCLTWRHTVILEIHSSVALSLQAGPRSIPICLPHVVDQPQKVSANYRVTLSSRDPTIPAPRVRAAKVSVDIDAWHGTERVCATAKSRMRRIQWTSSMRSRRYRRHQTSEPTYLSLSSVKRLSPVRETAHSRLTVRLELTN